MCAMLAMPLVRQDAGEADAELLDRLVALRSRAQLGESPASLAGDVRAVAEAAAAVGAEAARSVPDAALRLWHGALVAVGGLALEGDAAVDALVAGLEEVRTGVLAHSEGLPVGRDRTARQVLDWLVGTLAVPQRSLAPLLGVTARTLQRWLGGETTMSPADQARLRLVARAVNELRFTLSGPATVAWFTRERARLDGRRPLDLLDEPDGGEGLLRLVATARY